MQTRSRTPIARAFRRACRFICKNQRDRLAKELRSHPQLKFYTVADESLISHAYWANKDMIEFLCAHGVAPDLEDSMGGTVLIDASANGDIELLKTLIQFGANPNHQNKSVESGFSFACAWNQHESAKVLHAAGADINHLIGTHGGKPLDWALRDGSDQFISWLKKIDCVTSEDI